MRTAPERPRWWPAFSNPLRSTAVTARVGRVLGICFGVCFVTGMLSHYQYRPFGWLPEPATPAWGYRLTQGLHVVTGVATIPLLLVKLWSVYPSLFRWPPLRTLLDAVERLSVAILVSSALVELFTGFFNSLNWYPWPWDFISVHRFLAYVVTGSILLHIAVKLPAIRRGLGTPLAAAPTLTEQGSSGEVQAGRAATGGEQHPALTRRGLLIATGAGVGTVVVTSLGQTVTPLEPIGLLAIRQASKGPAGVPINRTAEEAQVRALATDPDWRLQVLGPHPFSLGIDALEAMAQHEASLPIACVEGWSVGATWRGLSLIDVVRRAGGDEGSRVKVTSLERNGSYNRSYIEGPQLSRALLATHLNDERLELDHGYPLRLIAPDRAGVLNTKWLKSVEVL